MADLPAPAPGSGSEFLLYQTEDGQTRLEVRLDGETVWLSQKLMAVLFQKDVRTINEHVQNLFAEKELPREGTIRNFRIVQPEGGRAVERLIEFYNLDVIISVGYRVKSLRGTQFRIWATQRLRDYIVKGFALDDQRLKEGGQYFDELLARIRDIRASEKLFYKKICAIFATSLDYDPQAEITTDFYAMVQNKMHWAAHGHTAAEIIAQRADAAKPNMGLTTWADAKIRKADVVVAKNYLRQEELDILNRIVSQYLDFAELQALSRKPMHMREWVRKLDDFLRVNDRDVLQGFGQVSHQLAKELAEAQYTLFHHQQITQEPSAAEKHFEATIAKLDLKKPRRSSRKSSS